jgi:integrase
MRGYIVKSGFFVAKIPYLKQKPSGLYYFRMGIPEDIRASFSGKREVVQSLKTKSEQYAIRAVGLLAAKYKQRFEAIRSGDDRESAIQVLERFGLEDTALIHESCDDATSEAKKVGSPYWTLLEHLSNKYGRGDYFEKTDSIDQRALDILHGNETITLSMVKERRLDEYKKDRRKQLEVERAFTRIEKYLSSTDLSSISVMKAQKAVNKVVEMEGVGHATVAKELSHLRRAVTDALIDFESDIKNPFKDVVIPRSAVKPKHRHTFSTQQLAVLRNAILEQRELVTAQIAGLQLDTGCRVGEIGGLLLSDIVFDDDWPYLNLKDNDCRIIKVKPSKRKVPLVGLSLEIATQLVDSAEPHQVYVFDQYIKGGVYKNDTCASAVNAFLKRSVDKGTSHSFRHAMRDRLYIFGVGDTDVKNIIGWSIPDMMGVYGVVKKVDRQHSQMQAMLEQEKAKATH